MHRALIPPHPTNTCSFSVPVCLIWEPRSCCEVPSHGGFHLHFPSDSWHLPLANLILFGGMSKACCPSFTWVVLWSSSPCFFFSFQLCSILSNNYRVFSSQFSRMDIQSFSHELFQQCYSDFLVHTPVEHMCAQWRWREDGYCSTVIESRCTDPYSH
jgi:hypothetical protein